MDINSLTQFSFYFGTAAMLCSAVFFFFERGGGLVKFWQLGRELRREDYDYILDLQGAEYIQSANQCASTTTNESLLGDVNYDTAVNVLDVVMVVSYVVGVTNLNTNQINSADMNQDQAVNVLDVVALVNIIVNQ